METDSVFRCRLRELTEDLAPYRDELSKLSFLLEMSAYCPPEDSAFADEAHRFPGCQSQVWARLTGTQKAVHLELTSDTMLLRGVFYILMLLVNDLPVREFQDIRFGEVLTVAGWKDLLLGDRTQNLEKLFDNLQTAALSLPEGDTE